MSEATTTGCVKAKATPAGATLFQLSSELSEGSGQLVRTTRREQSNSRPPHQRRLAKAPVVFAHLPVGVQVKVSDERLQL